MSQMMDPGMMGGGPPPMPPDPGMGGGGPGLGPEMGAPPPPDAGGGLPPELMAALGGGGGMNSTDLMAEGPMAGEETATTEEDAGEEDPLTMVRDAIALLRKAGEVEPDDVKSHLIDKVQADLQKILSTESQKTDKLRSALGG